MAGRTGRRQGGRSEPEGQGPSRRQRRGQGGPAGRRQGRDQNEFGEPGGRYAPGGGQGAYGEPEGRYAPGYGDPGAQYPPDSGQGAYGEPQGQYPPEPEGRRSSRRSRRGQGGSAGRGGRPQGRGEDEFGEPEGRYAPRGGQGAHGEPGGRYAPGYGGPGAQYPPDLGQGAYGEPEGQYPPNAAQGGERRSSRRSRRGQGGPAGRGGRRQPQRPDEFDEPEGQYAPGYGGPGAQYPAGPGQGAYGEPEGQYPAGPGQGAYGEPEEQFPPDADGEPEGRRSSRRPRRSRRGPADPGARTPSRRPRRQGSVPPNAFFVAAGVIVVLAVVVVAAVLVLTRSGGGHGAAAPEVKNVRAEGPGAAAYSQAASTEAFAAIADRSKDAKPLTAAAAFATKKISDTDAKASLKLTASRLDSHCTAAVWGTRLAGLLQQGGCTQAARATYTDKHFGAVVTIFNLVDAQAADRVVANADPRSGNGFPLAPPRSPAFGQSFSTARGVAMGHYAVITWVQRADGTGDESDAALLSLLVTTGRPNAVLIRATGQTPHK